MPWILMYTEEFENLPDAKKRELQLKKMKSRKYIEELIEKRSSMKWNVDFPAQLVEHPDLSGF